MTAAEKILLKCSECRDTFNGRANMLNSRGICPKCGDNATFSVATQATPSTVQSASSVDAEYEYKCIPGPMEVIAQKGDAAKACEEIAAIMNRETRDGWEYYGMDTITTREPAGCLALLGGQTGDAKISKMLIFRRKLRTV